MSINKKLWLRFGIIVLITAGALIVAIPGGPNLQIGSWRRAADLRLGLDLKGGTHLVYDADVSKLSDEDRQSALAGVRDVIERRVNQFGVSEPVIQTNRSGEQWRVIVDLPGVKDVREAIQLIGETPLLEFREQTEPKPKTAEEQKQYDEQVAAIERQANDVLQRAVAPGADFAALANEFSQDPGNAGTDGAKLGGDLGFAERGQFVPEFDAALFDQLKDGQVTPALVKTQFGFHIIKRIESKTEQRDGKDVLSVHGAHILFSLPVDAPTEEFTPTELTGKQLRRALVQFDQTNGSPEVALEFNDEGKALFAEITKRNVGKPVGIFLDNAPLSIPVVQQEITGGTAVITGSFTVKEAKDLAQRLNAGALPIPITLASQQTIGPSLGREAIDRSLFAGVVGIALIIIFMLVFYRLPGLVASLALGVYTVIVLAIFKLWPVTLTLAGVAGFILSIGIAVDANILIFERTKEELRRGRQLMPALEDGFLRAWLSIRDSNLSGLLTTLILYTFGTGIIKGFALTLAIGIVVSMFSAITVTRTFLRLIVRWRFLQHPWLFGVRSFPHDDPHV
jgi:protein-export membrane protein SecD